LVPRMDMLCLDRGAGRTRCGTKTRIAPAHDAVVSHQTSAMLQQRAKTPVAHARHSGILELLPSAQTPLSPLSRLHLIACGHVGNGVRKQTNVSRKLNGQRHNQTAQQLCRQQRQLVRSGSAVYVLPREGLRVRLSRDCQRLTQRLVVLLVVMLKPR
jgi:hypothetical protein